MMGRPKDYRKRAEVNDRSRNTAKHHAEPWDAWEVELLLDWTGDEDELMYLAEELGRTVEACRQHYYVTRRHGNCAPVEGRSTKPSIQSHWCDDDERDYPSEWYVR